MNKKTIYYCPKCEEDVPTGDLVPSGKVDVKKVDEKGYTVIGTIYKHKNCGTKIEEK